MRLCDLKYKKELISLVLLGTSVALAALILVKTTSFFAASARAENLVKTAAAQDERSAEEARESATMSLAIAEQLKRENLFAPPRPRQHPVSSVLGILGNEALIAGKWYKVGEDVGDAKILAIEPTCVRIEWEGREKAFAPIQATGQSGSDGSGPVKRDIRNTTRSNKAQRGQAVVVQVGGVERNRAGGGWDGKFPEKEKAKLRAKAEKQQRPAVQKETYKELSKQDVKAQKKDAAIAKRISGDKKPKKKTARTEMKKSAQKKPR